MCGKGGCAWQKGGMRGEGGMHGEGGACVMKGGMHGEGVCAWDTTRYDQ